MSDMLNNEQQLSFDTLLGESMFFFNKNATEDQTRSVSLEHVDDCDCNQCLLERLSDSSRT